METLSESVSRVEYAVDVKCDTCANRIEQLLKPLNGVKLIDIDVNQKKLLLELDSSGTSVHEIQSLIESQLSITTVIKGIGDSVAAVSEIHGSDDVIGVIRFTQLVNKYCLIDGVIDGIRNNTADYSLNIHQYGDLSGQAFENLGQPIIPILERFNPNDTAFPSRTSFKTRVPNCDLSEYIGRALAVSAGETVIGAGIVARASIVGDNSKKICACSGQTLWDERQRVSEERTSRL